MPGAALLADGVVMSAVATDWKRNVVRSMLREWGRWVEDHSDETGYPSQSAIAGVIYTFTEHSWFRVRQLTAQGKGTQIFGGHRILCRDMPDSIRMTNIMVGRLPDALYDAVLARWGLVLRPDGRIYSGLEQAHALGISYDAFDQRLLRAHAALEGMI